MSRHLRAACLAALVPLSAVPARAAAPTDTLRDFFTRVNGLIQVPEEQMTIHKRVALIRRLTHEVFDVRRAAADALGKEWPARTAAEQEEFVGLFGDVLQRGYLALVGSKAKINGGVDVAFIDEALTGDAAVVRTTLTTRSNDELPIDYRMSRAGGTWRVVDTMIGGMSLVGNYRAQFTRVLQRSTYPELIALMRAVAGESPHPDIAVAEAVTPNETVTSAGGDVRVPAAIRSAPFEMAPVTLLTPSAQAPPRAAAVPPHTSAIGARPPVTNTPRGGTVPNAPSLSFGSARGDAKRFWVQIGAFRNSESPVRLVERLAEPGVTIVTPPAAGRASVPLTWVCVGPFARRSAAVAKARELVAAGYRAFVTTQLP